MAGRFHPQPFSRTAVQARYRRRRQSLLPFSDFRYSKRNQKPKPTLVARDPLHQYVVVLGRGKIAPTRFCLTDNRFGKVIKGARVRSGAVELERFIRPGRIYLVPSGNFSPAPLAPTFSSTLRQ